MTAFDGRGFRNVLGQFATGVAVITAEGPDSDAIGLTMNSFTSVSLNPPLILFTLDCGAYSLEAMRAARGYAVNVLSQSQEHLSNNFAEALTDKWGSVDYQPGHGNAPLLAGAVARLQCEPYATHDAGDHVIFVCRVVRFDCDPSLEPLVFFRGRYTALDRGEAREPMWPLPLHY